MWYHCVSSSWESGVPVPGDEDHENRTRQPRPGGHGRNKLACNEVRRGRGMEGMEGRPGREGGWWTMAGMAGGRRSGSAALRVCRTPVFDVEEDEARIGGDGVEEHEI